MFKGTPIVKKIFYLNIFVFASTILLHLIGFPLMNYFALFPPEHENFHFFQFITSLFMHANLLHIFFNMLVFLSFSPDIEERLGERKFLIFYLLIGIGGSLTQLILNPSPMVGASGSIFGIMTMFTLYNPNTQLSIFFLPITFKAKNIFKFIIAFELIMALTSDGNVGHFCHLGGSLTGFLLKKINDNYL